MGVVMSSPSLNFEWYGQGGALIAPGCPWRGTLVTSWGGEPENPPIKNTFVLGLGRDPKPRPGAGCQGSGSASLWWSARGRGPRGVNKPLGGPKCPAFHTGGALKGRLAGGDTPLREAKCC